MSGTILDRESLLLKAALNFLDANEALMKDSLWNLGESLHEGTLTPGQFRQLALQEIRQGAAAQFRFALGHKPDQEQLAVLNTLLDSQAKYLENFVSQIPGMTDTGGVPARAALYAGAAVQAAALGKLVDAPEGSVVVWSGPDGPVSCMSCAPLIGQSWDLAEFLDLGVHPGLTNCDGNCRCRISIEAPESSKSYKTVVAAQTGAMICFFVPQATRAQLRPYVLDSTLDLHVTLAYLGKAAELSASQRTDILEAMARVAEGKDPLVGHIGGVARFPASSSSDGKDVYVALVDVPGLAEFRQYLIDTLHIKVGEIESTDHEFRPHVTLGYIDPGERLPRRSIPPIPVKFGALSVVFAGERTDLRLGTIAKMALKYNPDQPRDPAGEPTGGQWTSESGADLSPDETAASRKFLEDAVGGAMDNDAQRVRMKQEISLKIADLLANDEAFNKDVSQRTDKEIAALTDGEVLKITGNNLPVDKARDLMRAMARGDRASAVSDQLAQWAGTSGDSNAAAVSFQVNVAKEFGLKDYAQPWNKPGGYTEANASRIAIRKQESERAIARAIYTNTQNELKKAGIAHLTLYRGMKFEYEDAKNMPDVLKGLEGRGKILSAQMQPLSSFTPSPYIAAAFAGGTGRMVPHSGTIVAMRVPAARIFSTTHTGIGALPEYEVVVLGGKGQAFFVPAQTLSLQNTSADSRRMVDRNKDKDLAYLAKQARAAKVIDAIGLDDVLSNADWPKRTDDVRIFDLIKKRGLSARKTFSVKYSPDQPRAPQGSYIGGEWVPAGGASSGGEIDPRTSIPTLTRLESGPFDGNPRSQASPLGKQDTGKVAENVVAGYLRQFEGQPEVKHANAERNNFPVDLSYDHVAVEVKGGRIDNSPRAQQWRLTIGQPGKEETAALRRMSETERAQFNTFKSRAILTRKAAEMANLERITGGPVKARTITAILDHDRRTAYLYAFEGFHQRIGWISPQAKEGYLGAFKY